ncbi:DUF421 domain-containing protein [Paenibacillus sp. 1P07SE]|uniref:DUF421 domain-containing protein n=1 Tax=Paenibacillus sp. 1P07SE TaxID=3132209 RepID=UPI0039A4A8D1
MFFDTWSALFRIVVIGVLSYAALILIVRLSGKRTLSKMNAFDFTVSIALGSVLSTVILDKQITLSEGLTAFGVLIGMQALLAWMAARSKTFQAMLTSEPQLVFYKGNYMRSAMKKARIQKEDILQAARSEGISSIQEVGFVILEDNGKLSVIPHTDAPTDLVQDAKQKP